MEKIWLKSYPPGVPADIDISGFNSLGDVFDRSVRLYGSRTAYVCMDKAITYDELDRLTAQFAGFLQGELGLPKGARVAIMMPNVLQYPIAAFGTLRAGYVVVNVNPLYTPRELEHQLNDSGAEAIVIVENFCTTLQQILKDTPVKTVVTTGLGDMLGFPKSAIVNFVVKHVKKMVPAWHIPGTIGFRDALTRGARHALKPVQVTLDERTLELLAVLGGGNVSKGIRVAARAAYRPSRQVA